MPIKQPPPRSGAAHSHSPGALIDHRSHELNELARLYPWRSFTQSELQLMTGYGREVVSAAFNDPVFACQFGRARPENLAQWVQQLAPKIQTKEIRIDGKGAGDE